MEGLKIREDARFVIRRLLPVAIIALAAAALWGCGRSSGPTQPEAPPPEPQAARPAELPANVYGAFAAGGDVPEAAANAGNVVVVVPSYADDAGAVAGALRANGKVAILSAHHVFGGTRAGWERGWADTLRWAEPLLPLVAAVLVVDEPLHNGVPAADRDDAVALVRRAGFRTLVTEWVDRALAAPRPAADLYGVTCYSWPGPGSWSVPRCAEAYASHPDWNLVVGQGFDVYEGSRGSKVWNGEVSDQVQVWADLGRKRAGVVFWVWRWPGQLGIGDDPALRAAYNRAGGR